MIEGIKAALKAFLDFLDNRAVFRRVAFMVSVWMTWAAFEWAKDFAINTTRDGLQIAAIIGAVTAPISALCGYTFKVYTDDRTQT